MARFIVFRDVNGQFRWRFGDNRGKIIADSAEGYTDKSDCERCIKSYEARDSQREDRRPHQSALLMELDSWHTSLATPHPRISQAGPRRCMGTIIRPACLRVSQDRVSTLAAQGPHAPDQG